MKANLEYFLLLFFILSILSAIYYLCIFEPESFKAIPPAYYACKYLSSVVRGKNTIEVTSCITSRDMLFLTIKNQGWDVIVGDNCSVYAILQDETIVVGKFPKDMLIEPGETALVDVKLARVPEKKVIIVEIECKGYETAYTYCWSG